MKIILFLLLAISLCSCNTTIVNPQQNYVPVKAYVKPSLYVAPTPCPKTVLVQPVRRYYAPSYSSCYRFPTYRVWRSGGSLTNTQN